MLMQIFTAPQPMASKYVASEIADVVRRVTPHRTAELCFATGSSPLGVYRELIETVERDELDLTQGVSTWNLDEYVGLPDNHVERYWSFMDRNLLLQRAFLSQHDIFPAL